MRSKNESREAEQRRVDKVIDEINQKEVKLYAKATGLKESVIDLRKNFWDDVTVNLDEPDDVIETQASIKQQAELLSERERFHGKIGEELKTLKKLKNSPYFGRIDFWEEREPESEPIYIGISSLMDNEDEDFLVYDWRAPISSLYYDYSPGEAKYKTVDETINGEITLKRQFIIRDGIINGMFDTGVTIGDQLLQQALGNNASTTMKSIVATIQKEQNKIIRDERNKLLIVQGVAGSGKTSAALQRIAYLMYRYRETLTPENVVLFSPNPLFSSYVSNVLPELGEANVKQTTFHEYLEAKVGEQLSIESPFQYMEYKLAGVRDDQYRTKMESIDYKSSLKFKQHVDEFVAYLANEGLLFKTISFRKQVLVSKEQIQDYFYSLDPAIAIPNKMELVTKWLLAEIRKQQREEQNKDWVMEQIELLDKEDYLEAYKHTQKQDQMEELYASGSEEEFLRKVVVKKVFSVLKKRIKQFEFVNVFATYRKFFKEWSPKEVPEHWNRISEQTVSELSRNFLSWEDAVPYAYFQGQILGDSADRSVRHLFIDEAQDYSPFQFAYIKSVFPYTKMTLLGDINQAIYTHAVEGSPLIPENSQENHERIVLTKSYRSTKQIVEFTKYFAPAGDIIEPFNREGTKPDLVEVNDKVDINKTLQIKIEELKGKGHETIAVICKTQQESEATFAMLKPELPVKQLNEASRTFEKGILVLPVYLAKGIEFDAVIIPDASDQKYALESDRTLFYTACTRAMHELTMMLAVGEKSLFIMEAPQDKYNVV
ncbi:RNA polymerase recycling motor HelD [Lentibacillus sp. Marseille-P4043]|uniref:RNA polymerase recycling motor HelD n=1 Tax=Lentibacillus sp. Marseille-P4043 TaxID=2040293 RepID=UPI000D0ADB37|nr:RNA polymerase recycling motor HelD [Lentibacillus sp. Marseille-P4043]